MSRRIYSVETRMRVLRACWRAQGDREEIAKVLTRYDVPRSTYLAWQRRYEETGSVDDRRRGRPPGELRTIIREEIERGLSGGSPSRSGHKRRDIRRLIKTTETN